MKPWSHDWLIAAGAYPGFCSMKRLGVFLLLQEGKVLLHRRSLPPQFTGTHLYSWVERGTVRVKCLAQEHNTVSSARARNRTARAGNQCTVHEATALPTILCIRWDFMRGRGGGGFKVEFYGITKLTPCNLSSIEVNAILSHIFIRHC